MTPIVPFLLDTNILLHYVRESPLFVQIEEHYHLLEEVPPMVSVVSVGEIFSLARQFQWGATKQKRISQILEGCLQISIDLPVLLEAYALIDAHNITVGRKMGDNDVWIAATAHVTKANLLTTDKDFDHLHTLFLQRDWIDPILPLSETP